MTSGPDSSSEPGDSPPSSDSSLSLVISQPRGSGKTAAMFEAMASHLKDPFERVLYLDGKGGPPTYISSEQDVYRFEWRLQARTEEVRTQLCVRESMLAQDQHRALRKLIERHKRDVALHQNPKYEPQKHQTWTFSEDNRAAIKAWSEAANRDAQRAETWDDVAGPPPSSAKLHKQKYIGIDWSDQEHPTSPDPQDAKIAALEARLARLEDLILSMSQQDAERVLDALTEARNGQET